MELSYSTLHTAQISSDRTLSGEWGDRFLLGRSLRNQVMLEPAELIDAELINALSALDFEFWVLSYGF